jgi:EthD domain
MIRSVKLLRRKAGSTLAEFSAYWRDEHGPLVASHQTHLGIVRHVQTHRGPALEEMGAQSRSKRGGMEPPYDGVSETWYASEEAFLAARSSIEGRSAEAELTMDEKVFADPDASTLWFAHEYPQVSTQRERLVARPKTGIIKVHFSLRCRPELTVANAQRYWLTVHGPLVRSHAVARGTLGYMQVHRYESQLLEKSRTPQALRSDSFIGHAEAWFDSLVPHVGAEAADAEAAAIADEANFIDWSRSTLFFGKELVFVDRAWL